MSAPRSNPQHGDEAEIHAALHGRVTEATTNIDKLRAKEMLLEKQLEVVRETRTQRVNNREGDIRAIAAKAEDSALRNKKTELLAQFEKMIHDGSQLGLKALATRKKNESANHRTRGGEHHSSSLANATNCSRHAEFEARASHNKCVRFSRNG